MHALSRDGSAALVDPKVVESPIDSLEVPGRDLATLGPREFIDEKGDHILRLVLVLCVDHRQTTATRNIVEVDRDGSVSLTVRWGQGGPAQASRAG
jgi:hypothetical protein